MEAEQIVFSPEFSDLDLINEIASYPCLYHHLDPDYKNKEKEECWSHIGEKLDCPGNIVIVNVRKLLLLFYSFIQILVI